MKESSKKPIYLKLADFLENYIQNKMEKDQKLLSEREISEKLSISRYTVRQALNELEKKGYIYKVYGKGTFVAEKSVPTALNDIYSFTEQMQVLGKTPKTNLLEFKIFEANDFLASQLKIDTKEKIIKLKFLRMADNIPMMVEYTYLPYKKFSTLNLIQLSDFPLYDIMETIFKQKIHIINEEIQASIVAKKTAKLLKINTNSPCLKVKRISYNQHNEPIEYTCCIARSDQFVYKHSYVHQ